MNRRVVNSPIRLQPILVPRVWGGDRIVKEIHPSLRSSAGDLPIGESWEVSDVGDDPAYHSRVVDGPAAGETLRSLIEHDPPAMLGDKVHREGEAARLPLLFKFLDAKAPLSVQVHPSDELVARAGLHGEAGKTEAWFILDSDPDAWIVHGLEGVEYQEYLALARGGRGSEGLRRVTLDKGDLVYLPSGTVHAIGPGLLLAEIQQSSDSTYRLYDWDRLGLDGQPRTLHLDEAALVEPPELLSCPYPGGPTVDSWTDRLPDTAAPFTIDEVRSSDPVSLASIPGYFSIFCLLSGLASIELGGGPVEINAGDVFFVPAGCAGVRLIPRDSAIHGLWMSPR